MKFPEDSEFVCVLEWSEPLYQEALSWVEGARRVAMISEEERESKDPKVKIYHLETPLQIEGMARKIGWSAVFKRMTVILTSKYLVGLEGWGFKRFRKFGLCVTIINKLVSRN